MAGAASVGVFASFASLFIYTFGTLLKPLAEEFSWSREAVSAAFRDGLHVSQNRQAFRP